MTTAAEEQSFWTLIAAQRPSAVAQDREEAVWVARVRTGDAAAVRWLLGRYRGRAVRLAANILRSQPDEAEDVAQEAFVRAFRSLPQLRGDAGFSAWLYRIVVRLCLDRQRSARWHREVSANESLDSALHAPSESEGIDTRLLVEALLDQLAPPLRAALVLRELEGLEYEEIARVLRIPVGTVRSRLNTARAQFRELWLAAMEEDNHV